MKALNLTLYTILALLLFPFLCRAQEQCLHIGAGNIAPLGIMGSHTHNKGSWMFSYQMMNMAMRDNLAGSKRISNEAILQEYLMSPEAMNMQMHMFMGMYAVSDKVTLMGMFNYLSNHMSMTDRVGASSKMNNRNIGDASISALYNIFKTHNQSLQLNFGISVPTGSINEFADEDGHDSHAGHGHHGHASPAVPAGIPFMMQTGSGTWDVLPALTYTSLVGSFFVRVSGFRAR